VDIKTHEFLIYNKDTGKIVDRFFAYCSAIDYLPDSTTRIVLKHVDGILDNNLYFSNDVSICRADCFIDPTLELNFKLKKGTEEEFEFFMKNGYHKSGASV
tara:strand:- start:327 stop:629 length:303 start_codon:yes stop_codon:yes gene_type:complete